MKFTIAPAPGGRWAAGHIIPGTDVLTVLVDCPTQASAQAQARELQRQHDLQAPPPAIEPIDRPIVAGFYTDTDAA